MTVITRPRAIMGRVQATADPSVIRQLHAAFDDFKDRNNGRIDRLETGMQACIDDMNARIASLGLNGGVSAAKLQDPEYSQLFANWSRSGHGDAEVKRLNSEGNRANIQAAMSVGTDSAGGYLAPIEWDRQILSALRDVSPMRRIATVITTTVRAYTTVWNTKGWGSGWVGETAARTETASTPLASVPFGHGEIYANPQVTQQLLDDADFPMEQWIAAELADEFTFQEAPTFIAGNGVNKPNGFLTYVTGAANAATHPGGAINTKTAASATAITSDELVELTYALPAPYRRNATWLMNSAVASKIRLLKDGQGNYLWQPNLIAGQPTMLLGYPVELDENMPNMTAGALPVAFGDFRRGYVINDRMGVRILRDPYSNKPYVGFYATKRVGGGVRDPNAIRIMKMAAS